MGTPTPPPRGHATPARLGLLVWAAVAVLAPVFHLLPPWPEDLAVLLLLFSPLVLVPLGLSLVEETSRLWQTALRLHLPAALLLTVAFLLPPGPAAALLTLPWLLFTALIAG